MSAFDGSDLAIFSRRLSSSYLYARAQTPEYEFLDRCPRKAVESIRALIEEWFVKVPDTEKTRVRSGLRSRNDLEHWSTFFELYCHELLMKSGYSVQMHVTEVSGRAKDFKAIRASLTLDWEATICTDSDAIRSYDSLRDQVLDFIDEKSFVPGFRYSLEIEDSGKNLPGLKAMAQEIRKWAQMHDRKVLRAAYEATGYDALPISVFSANGWTLRITLIPRPKDEEDDDQFKKSIGIGPIFGGELHHDRALRNALKRKASHYSDFSLPFVIAVDTIFSFPMNDDVDVVQALLGTEQISFDPRTMRTALTHAPDGLWVGPNGPRNTGISAVFVVSQLRSWYVAKAPITVYLNPWASKPIEANALGVRTVTWDKMTGRPIDLKGRNGAEVFGLPPEWPEDGEDD